MIIILENIQLISTLLGLGAFIPEIIKIFKERSNASNFLNVATIALYIGDTLLRLPNLGSGLFTAIQKIN